MFGPVVLGTNRCDEDLPALLGCAEKGLDEAPTLGGLQDGIQLYTTHTIHGRLLDRPCFMFVGVVKVHVGRFADRHVGQFQK